MEQQLKLAIELSEGIRHGATAAPQLIKKTSHQLAFQKIAALVHSLGPLDARDECRHGEPTFGGPVKECTFVPAPCYCGAGVAQAIRSEVDDGQPNKYTMPLSADPGVTDFGGCHETMGSGEKESEDIDPPTALREPRQRVG